MSDTVLYVKVGREEKPVFSVSVDDPNHDDLLAAERQRVLQQARAGGSQPPVFRVKRGTSDKASKQTTTGGQ